MRDSKLPNDFDEELDGDSVFELLDHSSDQSSLIKPSPTFVQDTLRRIRLEMEEPSTSWWGKLLYPKVFWGASTTALATLAFIITLNYTSPEVKPIANSGSHLSPTEEWNDLGDALVNELLVGVTEDPTLLSDEEIIALIF